MINIIKYLQTMNSNISETLVSNSYQVISITQLSNKNNQFQIIQVSVG